MAIPHAFFNTAASEAGIKLPAVGEYAIGQFFMPNDPEKRAAVKAQMEATATGLDMPVLGWRTVPTDNSMLGDGAKSTEPVIEQVCLCALDDDDGDGFFAARFELCRRVARGQALRMTGTFNHG